MADYSFILFDSAAFSTTDEVDFVLFQVAEGGDATHVKAFTNSRGAGQLPSVEKFSLKHIEVFPNERLVIADAGIWFVDGYLSLEIQNKEVFRAPLASVIGGPAPTGHFAQAVAADLSGLEFNGKGFDFEIPLEIPGGTPFKVTLHQGTVLATATQLITCALHGTLTTP